MIVSNMHISTALRVVSFVMLLSGRRLVSLQHRHLSKSQVGNVREFDICLEMSEI